MRFRARNLLAGILTTCALVWALPAEADTDIGHVRFVRYSDIYHLNMDGTFVRELSETKRALTSTGVNALGRQSFTYNDRLESFRVLQAATLKADGTRIAVDPHDIQTQAGMLSTGLDPSMEDYKLVVVTFPRLAPGDSVTYTVQYHQTTPEFKGYFDVLKTFSRSVINDSTDIQIDAPHEMNLRVASSHVEAAQLEHDGDRDVYRWHYQRDHIDDYEPYTADGRLADAYIEASNYPSYAAIGAAYDLQARDKAVPTAAVSKLADDLTQGLVDPRQEAEAIYDWVRQNIRYVATYIGAGGWVPHDADWTLAHRYGDCKDHVTLLAALLAAKGIDSEPVLINADMSSFTLPSVPVRSFNHAISYLPRWHLYLDSTDDLAPFGVLPEADRGRPVLHAGAQPYLAETSLPRAAEVAIKRQVEVRIGADGSADVDLRFSGSGISALAMRSEWQQVGKGGEARWLKDLLHSEGYEATGSANFEDAGGEAVLSAHFRIADYLRNTDAGAVSADTFLPSPASFNGLISVFRPASRQMPYECYPSAIHDSIRYQFPQNLKILAVPKSAQIDTQGFAYSAKTSLDGQVFELQQDFTEERSKGRCEAEEYAAQRATVLQIKRNVTAQVLYAER